MGMLYWLSVLMWLCVSITQAEKVTLDVMHSYQGVSITTIHLRGSLIHENVSEDIVLPVTYNEGGWRWSQEVPDGNSTYYVKSFPLPLDNDLADDTTLIFRSVTVTFADAATITMPTTMISGVPITDTTFSLAVMGSIVRLSVGKAFSNEYLSSLRPPPFRPNAVQMLFNVYQQTRNKATK